MPNFDKFVTSGFKEGNWREITRDSSWKDVMLYALREDLLDGYKERGFTRIRVTDTEIQEVREVVNLVACNNRKIFTGFVVACALIAWAVFYFKAGF